jgi:hypothetical protein
MLAVESSGLIALDRWVYVVGQGVLLQHTVGRGKREVRLGHNSGGSEGVDDKCEVDEGAKLGHD